VIPAYDSAKQQQLQQKIQQQQQQQSQQTLVLGAERSNAASTLALRSLSSSATTERSFI